MKEVVLSNSILAARVNETSELLRTTFSGPFRNTYLGGKTAFRDFFYEKLGCSMMEAEAVVDLLEKTARIEFKKDSQGGGYGTWEIH